MQDALTLGELADALKNLRALEGRCEKAREKYFSSDDEDGAEYYELTRLVEKQRSRELDVCTNFLYEDSVCLRGES